MSIDMEEEKNKWIFIKDWFCSYKGCNVFEGWFRLTAPLVKESKKYWCRCWCLQHGHNRKGWPEVKYLKKQVEDWGEEILKMTAGSWPCKECGKPCIKDSDTCKEHQPRSE